MNLLVVLLLSGWVDPYRCGQDCWFRVFTDESFGVALVGDGQDLGADRVDDAGVSLVDVVRSVPGNTGVPMLDVVPGEEVAAEGSGLFDVVEAVGGSPDVHPRVAMQVLRHARSSVTMEIYTQVSNKATRDALPVASA
ncbi:hypothetical protein C7C45_07750 [Micromonospora arborensis]|uniref:Uncharacterized protein n=1 Tax=Micromonospora arborensis TaxID=2116518 RepID=A0A318NMQ3_9ACTN|nr:hypothetical protein C7C45_07750 [Micromonospora arborensis]